MPDDDNLDLLLELFKIMHSPKELANEMAKPNSKVNQLMDKLDTDELYYAQDYMAFEQEPKEEKPPEPVIVKDPKDIWDVL